MTKSIVKFGVVPREHWSYPAHINQTQAALNRKDMEARNVAYADSESYRHMCRYESGFIFHHELVQEYDYYWRVEPGVSFSCDLDFDPFMVMKTKKIKYGFTIALPEFVNTIPTLWENVRQFMRLHPEHISKRNSLEWISYDKGETYNNCHFWSNFEIVDLSFFRSKAYTDFFNLLDQAGGFFYERWGDAPVHSIAAALMLERREIRFFNEIGYRHEMYEHCPESPSLQLKCACDPKDNVAPSSSISSSASPSSFSYSHSHPHSHSYWIDISNHPSPNDDVDDQLSFPYVSLSSPTTIPKSQKYSSFFPPSQSQPEHYHSPKPRNSNDDFDYSVETPARKIYERQVLFTVNSRRHLHPHVNPRHYFRGHCRHSNVVYSDKGTNKSEPKEECVVLDPRLIKKPIIQDRVIQRMLRARDHSTTGSGGSTSNQYEDSRHEVLRLLQQSRQQHHYHRHYDSSSIYKSKSNNGPSRNYSDKRHEIPNDSRHRHHDWKSYIEFLLSNNIFGNLQTIAALTTTISSSKALSDHYRALIDIMKYFSFSLCNYFNNGDYNDNDSVGKRFGFGDINYCSNSGRNLQDQQYHLFDTLDSMHTHSPQQLVPHPILFKLSSNLLVRLGLLVVLCVGALYYFILVLEQQNYWQRQLIASSSGARASSLETGSRQATTSTTTTTTTSATVNNAPVTSAATPSTTDMEISAAMDHRMEVRTVTETGDGTENRVLAFACRASDNGSGHDTSSRNINDNDNTNGDNAPQMEKQQLYCVDDQKPKKDDKQKASFSQVFPCQTFRDIQYDNIPFSYQYNISNFSAGESSRSNSRRSSIIPSEDSLTSLPTTSSPPPELPIQYQLESKSIQICQRQRHSSWSFRRKNRFGSKIDRSMLVRSRKHSSKPQKSRRSRAKDNRLKNQAVAALFFK
ncbi:alpha 1,2-mannosyltransferase 2.4.1 [Haplosporangium sp. Z 27]|nr:alpha 1,2-mannosyltransferase 2.4.1 [Haplosporangium sp. Z 27]